MVKVLPVLMAIFLSVMHFQFFDDARDLENKNLFAENKNPRNHLTQDSAKRNEVTAKVMSVGEASPQDVAINLSDAGGIQGNEQGDYTPISHHDGQTVLRITWQLVPYAVKYKVVTPEETFVSYTGGIELALTNPDQNIQITALDYDGNVVDGNVQIITREVNPVAPLTTSEFDKMSFSPEYLVYSWIPTNGADHYEIQLIQNGNVIREFVTEYHPKDDNFDFYDSDPILEEGNYFWRVRGLSADDTPITAWSAKKDGNSFTVKLPVRFCAIGDSITHGGGSISVPPSNILYNWETYCSVPVKNLGKSGDTTGDILDRFDRDVLPFKPEVLFIMAGVNDYRSGILGWTAVTHLKEINEKCKMYGIKPVFITPTPINSRLIRKVKFVEIPPPDWQTHMKYVCDWVRAQENHIDIAELLMDGEGNLRADLSTDGLHPDIEGKEIIGHAVGDWLNNYLDSFIPVD